MKNKVRIIMITFSLILVCFFTSEWLLPEFNGSYDWGNTNKETGVKNKKSSVIQTLP